MNSEMQKIYDELDVQYPGWKEAKESAEKYEKERVAKIEKKKFNLVRGVTVGTLVTIVGLLPLYCFIMQWSIWMIPLEVRRATMSIIDYFVICCGAVVDLVILGYILCIIYKVCRIGYLILKGRLSSWEEIKINFRTGKDKSHRSSISEW